jgi:hypothetical protein
MVETSANVGPSDLATSEGGGGLGAISESMTALTQVTKGISGVVEGIFQVIGKLFNAIIDASPLLQGVLKIIDKMFKLVLMPIGNMIGRLLLPYVIKMARKTTEYLSKFGNAGPEQMGEILTEGLTMALESLGEMLAVVFSKVLWPVITALGQSIINAIQWLFTGGLAGSLAAPGYDENAARAEIGKDVNALLGAAATGIAGVIDTFGFTVQTGNRIMGNSFAETSIAMYRGTADIANGFQSVHDVLVVGSTKAIQQFAADFHLAGAGLVTVLDTIRDPIELLVEKLKGIIDTVPEPPPKDGGGKEEKKGINWLKALLTMPIYVASMLPKSDEDKKKETERWVDYLSKPGLFQSGGIVTRPTNAIIGEAGPEAIIPLNRAGAMGGQPIHIHFHGDVYGMDDFERKVEKTVSKYGGRVRGAY